MAGMALRIGIVGAGVGGLAVAALLGWRGQAVGVTLATGEAVLDNCALAEALPRYTTARRWHRRFHQAMSAAFTPMYQSQSRLLPVLRDHVFAPVGPMPPIRQMLTALVSGDLLPPLAGTRWP